MREIAAQILALALKHGAAAPLMIGHRLTAISLLCTGDVAQGREHSDQALELYHSLKDRSLAMRFGQDAGVSILCYRALANLLLGFADTALADAEQALKDAREIGQTATLIYALVHAWLTHLECGKYNAVSGYADELTELADEKALLFWRASGMLAQGCALAMCGRASDGVQMITSGIAAWRSTGSTMWLPLYLLQPAKAHLNLKQFDEAWRCIGEALTAVEKTKERWWEAEVNRTAGEIALLEPKPHAAKAEMYFERALTVARQQQAKSWELRAAMSMARLWRDQRKQQQARELLAPVYGWFTEGFDTLDLKEAKALLEELAC